jgi:hypothetical protein
MVGVRIKGHLRKYFFKSSILVSEKWLILVDLSPISDPYLKFKISGFYIHKILTRETIYLFLLLKGFADFSVWVGFLYFL